MHGPGRMVVTSSQMCPMRSHRLLRQFAKSACIETLRRYGSSDNHELRAGRTLVLRLPHRRILRRPEASRSSLPSIGSTGTGTGRSGPFKLANAAQQIGTSVAIRRPMRLPCGHEERHDFAMIAPHYANCKIGVSVRSWVPLADATNGTISAEHANVCGTSLPLVVYLASFWFSPRRLLLLICSIRFP
jgi:hypothetical protein